MNDDAVLAAETLIGDDADKFLRSELGRTILGIAQQERDAALLALKACDADDVKKIRQLQNEIWRAESLEGWLRELIRRGEQALQIIEHDEDYK